METSSSYTETYLSLLSTRFGIKDARFSLPFPSSSVTVLKLISTNSPGVLVLLFVLDIAGVGQQQVISFHWCLYRIEHTLATRNRCSQPVLFQTQFSLEKFQVLCPVVVFMCMETKKLYCEDRQISETIAVVKNSAQ